VRHYRLILIAFTAAAGMVASPAPSRAGAGPAPESARFAFGLFGNQRATSEGKARFGALVDSMNGARLAFSIDDGGIGAAPGDCSDDYELETRDLFDRFEAPLFYTPGQADWAACGGGATALERLGALRRVFFATAESQGGHRLAVDRQAPYFRENARWTYGSVTFATVHVIGNGNGEGRDAQGDREVAARVTAAKGWVDGTFAEAARSGSRGVVLVWQADPHFGQHGTAYDGLRGDLRARTIAFGRPVILVHGDGGDFRIDKPMVDDRGRRVENFTRVETFGPAETDWVEGLVDPSDPGLFTFRPEIVPPAATTGPEARR
jgi:hypothetical protein